MNWWWSILVSAMMFLAGCTDNPTPEEPGDDAQTMPEPSEDPEAMSENTTEPEPPAPRGTWHNETYELQFTRVPGGSGGDGCIVIESEDHSPFTVLQLDLVATWNVDPGQATDLQWIINDEYGDYRNETEFGPSPITYHDELVLELSETGTATGANGEITLGPALQLCVDVEGETNTINQDVELDISALIDGNVTLE